jgi:RNA polymerase sigma-70 factor (ECF subfamily)
MPFDPRILTEQLAQFTAFVRRRLDDPTLAEDVVQQAVQQALQRSEQLDDGDRVLAWFWRILRNATADVQRRQGREAHHRRPLPGDFDELPAAEQEQLCQCLQGAIAALPKAQQDVLQAVDLAGASANDVAAAQGIPANRLNVRRHRARQALRRQLLATCGLCARHGCVDCDCGGA